MSSLVPNPSDGSVVVTSVTPKPSLMYQLVSALVVFPLFRGLLRGHTSGNALVPLQGPLGVVANHGSHLDPPLLGHRSGPSCLIHGQRRTLPHSNLGGH